MGQIRFVVRRVGPEESDPLNWRTAYRGTAGHFGDVTVLHGGQPSRVVIRGEGIPQAVLTLPRFEARAGGASVPRGISLIVGGQAATVREPLAVPARRRQAVSVDIAGRRYVRRPGRGLALETLREGTGVVGRLYLPGRSGRFSVADSIDDLDLAMVLILTYGVTGMPASDEARIHDRTGS